MLRSILISASLMIVPPTAIITRNASDVCRPGWAAQHRHVTTAQRRRIRARDHATAGGEIDHIVALELGGSNADLNLRWQPQADALLKDRAERRARADVCAGRTTLADAQRAMWVTA